MPGPPVYGVLSCNGEQIPARDGAEPEPAPSPPVRFATAGATAGLTTSSWKYIPTLRCLGGNSGGALDLLGAVETH